MGKPQLLPKARLFHFLFDKQDALVCLFNQGVVSVAGLATNFLIARNSPSEFGVYYIGMSLLLFARGFQQQLVSTPYTIYHHRQSESEMPAYRGSCLMTEFGFIGLTLICLGLMSIAVWAGWLYSGEVLQTLYVLLLFAPAILMREVVRHYCFTHSRNTSVFVIDVAISVLQIVGLLVLESLGMLSGATGWLAVGAACLLTIGYWYFRKGPAIEFQQRRFIKDWKLNWTFGKWAVAGQLVGSLPLILLPLLLTAGDDGGTSSSAAGTEGTGFFGICVTLMGVANIFNTGMLNFLTPKSAKVFVEHGSAGLKQLMTRMYLLFLVAIGGFALLMILFGELIVVQLLGDKYIGLQTVLTLLAVSKLFEGFSHTASGGLFAMERIKENFWVDVILMFVSITAAVLLIDRLGVLGAAWTTLIGSVTGATLRSILLVMFLRQKPHRGGQDG